MDTEIDKEIEILTRLLAYHYEIQGSIQELVAYQDRNYLVTSNSGEKFIFKVTVDSNDLDFIRAQNQIFNVLLKTSSDQLLPCVVPTIKGDLIVDFYIDHKICYARLLTYIEGEFLAEVKPGIAFYHELGRTFAVIDREMSGLEGSAIKTRTHEWDLSRVLELVEYVYLIEDPADRRLVHYFLMKYREEVVPVYHKLPKGLIHADGNDWNILVKQESGIHKVAGVIDFGDMVWGARVNEVAIVLAYAMMGREDFREVYQEVVDGYSCIIPLTDEETAILYYLIAARWCQTMVMSARKSQDNTGNDYHQVSVSGARRMLHRWVRQNPEGMKEVKEVKGVKGVKAVKEVKGVKGVEEVEEVEGVEGVVERYLYFSRAVSLAYKEPIRMSGAAMQYMYSGDGRTYLDCVNNIPHVGHCHPKVVEAGQRQMAKLNTNTRYLYESLDRYADKLLSKFQSTLKKVFFVNSGSAATDLAVRLAEAHTGKCEYLVLDYAYHGNTQAAIGLSPYKFNRKGGKGKPENVTILPTDGQTNTPQSSTLKTRGMTFFAESIVGCAGQIVLPKEFMQQTVREVRESGGIYVADEVQTGFGRVGHKFWAYELYDVVPDMVIIGKPMGNGHPMGAVVCTDEIAASFETGMEFFSSFGGNPVSCEIGLAVLDVIENENLQENARLVGDYLISELQSVFPYAVVRGSGLFLGIELNDPETGNPATGMASSIVNEMKERGFLLSTDGPFNNVIKFKPPMCFSMDNAKELIVALREVTESMVDPGNLVIKS